MNEERLYAQLGRLYMAFVLRGDENEQLAQALRDANDVITKLQPEPDGR